MIPTAILELLGRFVKAINASGIILAIFTGLACYVWGNGEGYDKANMEWSTRPPKVEIKYRTVEVRLDKIERDSLAAVITKQKSRLSQSERKIREAQEMYASLAAQLDSLSTGDSLEVPVATFEISTQDSDYVYVEYHFPPVNAFRHFLFLPAPRPVQVMDHYITVTGPPERPSLFVKLLKVGSYAAVLYGVAADKPGFIYGGAAGGITVEVYSW